MGPPADSTLRPRVYESETNLNPETDDSRPRYGEDRKSAGSVTSETRSRVRDSRLRLAEQTGPASCSKLLDLAGLPERWLRSSVPAGYRPSL